MATDTKTSPEDTTAEPKRKFKFPTAFTALFFVLVLVWVLTFIIPPGNTGPYNSGDLAGAVQVFFFVLAIGAFITVTIKTGALVHDAWAPYDTCTAPDHQLCCARALRELQAVTDAAPQGKWCRAAARRRGADRDAAGKRGDPPGPGCRGPGRADRPGSACSAPLP